MTGDEFEVEVTRLGRPDGHHPSAYGWDEGCVLCALCHAQIYEGIFFLEPCGARIQKEQVTHDS